MITNPTLLASHRGAYGEHSPGGSTGPRPLPSEERAPAPVASRARRPRRTQPPRRMRPRRACPVCFLQLPVTRRCDCTE